MQQPTIDHSIHSVLDRQLLNNCTSLSSNDTDCMISNNEGSFITGIPWFVIVVAFWFAVVIFTGVKKFWAEIRNQIINREKAEEDERMRKDLIENRLIKKRVKQLGSSVGDNECHDLESGLGGAPVPSPRDCRLQKTDLYLPSNQKNNDDDDNDDAIEEGSNDDELICTICWEEYKEHDEICYSQNHECAHCFHYECMKSWLETHDECPICRRNYLSPAPSSGEGCDCKSHHASDTSNHQQDESDPNVRLSLPSELEHTSEGMASEAEKNFGSNRSSNCTSVDSEMSDDEETPSPGVEMEEISLDQPYRIFEQQTVDRVEQ